MHASIRVTDAYRYYVAWLLCGIYTISIMDRQLVAVLVEPIRSEFALRDWHMGLLSGLAFALFYTTLGVPLARLADRNNRVNIMAVSLLVWSAFTGFTGLAKTFARAIAMSGGSFKRSVATVAWPTGEFGGMGLEGAVKLAYRNELAQIQDPAERRRKYEEMVAQMYERGKALSIATIFGVDDTIDPADTRPWLAKLLRSLQPTPRGPGKRRSAIDAW